jgi:hypothetical protein
MALQSTCLPWHQFARQLEVKLLIRNAQKKRYVLKTGGCVFSGSIPQEKIETLSCAFFFPPYTTTLTLQNTLLRQKLCPHTTHTHHPVLINIFHGSKAAGALS